MIYFLIWPTTYNIIDIGNIYICIVLQISKINKHTNLLAGNFSSHQLAYDAIVQRVHVTVDPVQRLHPVRPIARLREQVTWQVLWRHIVGLEGRLRRGRLRVRFQWWAWWLNEYLISLIIYIIKLINLINQIFHTELTLRALLIKMIAFEADECISTKLESFEFYILK